MSFESDFLDLILGRKFNLLEPGIQEQMREGIEKHFTHFTVGMKTMMSLWIFLWKRPKLCKINCKFKFYKLITSAFKMSVSLHKPLLFVVLFSLCFLRHEVININLRNKPEWYYTKHPFGQIPVLENSKCQLIYESVIACEYLDDAYPGKKLCPYDPYERARQKMLLDLFYKVYPSF